MVRALAACECRGTFEAHITVAVTNEQRAQFRDTCRELHVKPVMIELPAGRSPSQPMTGSYHRGSAPEAASEVATLARNLRERGYAITRVKLEAVATNDGVPDSDRDANTFPRDCYFEFHLKLLLDPNANTVPLEELCAQLGARLSRNAFKQRADGRSERFVTARVYHAGRRTAFAKADTLLAALTNAGYHIANQVREYSLFDSHANLDAGWLDDPNELEGIEGDE